MTAPAPDPDTTTEPRVAAPPVKPTAIQLAWLRRGLDQPGGKLPLFDESGQRISERTIRSCIEHRWAQPWFDNPLKPGWHVCRLTHLGREVALER